MPRLSNGDLRRRTSRAARRHVAGFSQANPQDALERAREASHRDARALAGRAKLFIQVKSFRRTEEG
jgi:hypothetical protein